MHNSQFNPLEDVKNVCIPIDNKLVYYAFFLT